MGKAKSKKLSEETWTRLSRIMSANIIYFMIFLMKVSIKHFKVKRKEGNRIVKNLSAFISEEQETFALFSFLNSQEYNTGNKKLRKLF